MDKVESDISRNMFSVFLFLSQKSIEESKKNFSINLELWKLYRENVWLNPFRYQTILDCIYVNCQER